MLSHGVDSDKSCDLQKFMCKFIPLLFRPFESCLVCFLSCSSRFKNFLILCQGHFLRSIVV